MKVKKSQLKSGFQVYFLGEQWNVIVEDDKVSLINRGHLLKPDEDTEFEVIHPVEYYCLCCNAKLGSQPNFGIEGGVILRGIGGYGSLHDDKSLEYAICDKCILL